jgi:glycerol-3-phosphate acyltransferase PlsX
MRIVLDAMGSDTHPDPEVEAAIQIASIYNEEILLVGPDNILQPMLQDHGSYPTLVKIIHAPEVLEMTDKPASNARRKAQNSMAIGMDLIKSGQGDAFITAGNTGGAMANALFRLGRIKGVKRPALTALFPVRNGKCVVLDIGANADCKAEYLMQFATMGAIYAEKVLGIKNPKIALLSNGEEAGKGNDLIKETFPQLTKSNLNFIGNVEGKELFNGEAHVVVTDGFTGNILLKSSEAVAKLLTDLIREEMLKSTRTKIGGLLAKPAFENIKKLMDPGEVGAAPLLGINGLVFVGHGRSDARALVNASRVARHAIENDLLDALRNAIQERMVESPDGASG